MVALVDDDAAETCSNHNQITRTQVGEGLDGGDGDVGGCELPIRDDARLHLEGGAERVTPLLDQVVGVDEDQRRLTAAGDGARPDDGLARPTEKDRRSLEQRGERNQSEARAGGAMTEVEVVNPKTKATHIE